MTSYLQIQNNWVKNMNSKIEIDHVFSWKVFLVLKRKKLFFLKNPQSVNYFFQGQDTSEFFCHSPFQPYLKLRFGGFLNG